MNKYLLSVMLFSATLIFAPPAESGKWKKERTLEETFQWFSDEAIRVSKYKWAVDAEPVLLTLAAIAKATDADNWEECEKVAVDALAKRSYQSTGQYARQFYPLHQTRLFGYAGFCQSRQSRFRAATTSFENFQQSLPAADVVIRTLLAKRARKHNHLLFAFFLHAKADNHIALKQFGEARSALELAAERGSVETALALERVQNAETEWSAFKEATLRAARSANTIHDKHTVLESMGELLVGEGFTAEVIAALEAITRDLSVLPMVSEAAKESAAFGQIAFKNANDLGDYELALDYYVSAIAMAPAWADLYLNLGLVYEAQKDYAAAAEALDVFIRLAPNDPQVNIIKQKVMEMKFMAQQAD